MSAVGEQAVAGGKRRRFALETPMIFRLWKREFGHYSVVMLRNDLIAGLTVAAVALPPVLAFGVASGATAAGIVTAIISGFVIGALSGAPY